MSNESLDKAIQDHFRAQQLPSPQNFEELWREAQKKTQASPRHGPQRWWSIAVAAGVLVVVAIVFDLPSDKETLALRIADAKQDVLFNELIATTRWHAPSDVLLNVPGSLHVWDVPQFDWLQVINSEES